MVKFKYAEVISEAKRLIAKGIDPLPYLNQFKFGNDGCHVRPQRHIS